VRPSPSSPLPEPDAEAREHSARVLACVRDAIVAGGGWLPFADYMQLALYAPGLGYYAAGARKFGAEGDFTTAPEMTPLFARALAAPVAAILAASQARDLVEFGAGTGVLAAELLTTLAALDALPAHYRILDVSPDLAARQRATLARLAPAQLARVEWVGALPDAIDGAVLMNEVLDAIPPHVIGRRAGAWFERGVAWDGALRWADRSLRDARLLALARERFPADGDYASEVNPAAEALVESVARRMSGGALLVLDYGFPRREYYHAQRSEGTLMAHYRHRAHADPFSWPGLTDLTAHVDFTAIALAGERGGLMLDGYAPMAGFLLGAGILDRLRDCGQPASVAYLREAAAVQRLLSPAEMGELFKVMALAARGGIVSKYFAAADRSRRL
jgi:SAM-dependent MidA family methyltransferase